MTDQKQEDDVLRRMLSTPPKPHKPPKESSLKEGGKMSGPRKRKAGDAI